MEKIDSFKVDHTTLKEGFYISRIDKDITTYDLRMRKPNMKKYLDNATMHSFEHMFATYIRNSDISSNIIYVGPMGCQTGFYLLVRDLEYKLVLEYVKKTLRQIIDHQGDMFGASEVECGNYKNLDVDLAKNISKEYLDVIEEIK